MKDSSSQFQLGAIATALSIAFLAVVVFIQSAQALQLWNKQYKANAIDGCAQYSQYTASRIRTDGQGENENPEFTAIDQYPIAWMFDECMRNKGVDYTRTDFSNIEENIE